MSSSKATRKPKPAAGKGPHNAGASTSTERSGRSVALNKGKPGNPAPAVEILRRIAARPQTPQSEESEYMMQLAKDIDAAIRLDDIERFSPEAMQALIASLTRLYAANKDRENHFPVVGPQSGVSATEAMVLCGAMLKATDLQVFELGLWVSWSSDR